MSLIRIARPGYPVKFIDQGPSQANMSGYGGSAIQARPTTTSHHKTDPRTGQHSAKPRGEALAPERAVCGKTLRIIGEPCARRAGHKYECASRAYMDNRAAGRRSGVGRWP